MDPQCLSGLDAAIKVWRDEGGLLRTVLADLHSLPARVRCYGAEADSGSIWSNRKLLYGESSLNGTEVINPHRSCRESGEWIRGLLTSVLDYSHHISLSLKELEELSVQNRSFPPLVLAHHDLFSVKMEAV